MTNNWDDVCQQNDAIGHVSVLCQIKLFKPRCQLMLKFASQTGSFRSDDDRKDKRVERSGVSLLGKGRGHGRVWSLNMQSVDWSELKSMILTLFPRRPGLSIRHVTFVVWNWWKIEDSFYFLCKLLKIRLDFQLRLCTDYDSYDVWFRVL